MPYSIVTHDVDLTPEEQEMAAAIIAISARWSELAALEGEAWRVFKDAFYDRLRTRLEDRLQSWTLEDNKVTIRYRAGSQYPATILPGCRQVRFYEVQRVDEPAPAGGQDE